MNRQYTSRVSSKNSERLLKIFKNTTGDYFFCRTLYTQVNTVQYSPHKRPVPYCRAVFHAPLLRPYLGSWHKSLTECCCEWVCDVMYVFNGRGLALFCTITAW